MPDGIRLEKGSMIFLGKSSYPLGTGLVDFLALDLSTQEEHRQWAIERFTDEKWIQSAIKEYNNLEQPTIRRLFSVNRGYETTNDSKEEVLKELAHHSYHYYIYKEKEVLSNSVYFGNTGVGDIDDIDPLSILNEKANFTKIQKEYLDAVYFCCDVDNEKLQELSCIERFFIYEKSGRFNLKYYESGVKSSLELTPDLTDADYDMLCTVDNQSLDYVPKPITNELVEYIKSLPIESFFVYSASTIQEFAYLEFTLMVQKNIKVRKCNNCGKYFVLKGNYDTKYCDRLAPGKTQNCQTIGATKKYKQKIESDALLKEYNRAYKRYYANARNGILSKSSFEKWSNIAKQKRSDYLSGTLNKGQFSSWLSQKP